ncbi:MAG: VanZ family protein, partial [Candidatus Limnocylindrales bacterium]
MPMLIRWARSESGEIAFVALALVLVWALLVAWRSRSGAAGSAMWASTKDVALVMAVAAILIFTIQPSATARPDWAHINLIPFQDLLRSIDTVGRARDAAIANLIGNVVLFVPLGVGLALRFGRLGVGLAVVLVSGLSMGVESLQALWPIGRSADITDVLMNTLGGLVGFVLVRAMSVPAPQP